MAWTYILECVDGTYYIGSTTDLDLRLGQHNAGDGAVYTRTRLPVRLVYSEEYDSVRDAFNREKHLQKWSRAKRQALIDGDLDALRAASKKDFEKRPNPG